MDLKEISVNTKNWDDSAQDRDNCRGIVKPPGFMSIGLVI